MGFSEAARSEEAPSVEIDYVKREQVKLRRATAPTFSVMSYNILGSVNLIDNGQFGYTPKWALPIGYRLPRIIKEIEYYEPDLICLQEVDHSEEIAGHFHRLGYSSEFNARGGRFVEGCQTLYKTSKFRLIHSEKLLFNQVVEEYRVNKKDFRRSNIAQLLTFEMHGFRFPLCVANTHLYWDPSYEYVKLAQAHYLMHHIDSLKSKHNVNYPVVLAGDFNSKPYSRVYELINRGLPKETTKRKDILLRTHNTPLASAYECLKEPPTNFASVFTGTLDYIFYSKKQLSLTSLLKEHPQTSEPLQKYRAAPNPAMPSDHVPIMATFSCEQEVL